MMNKAQADIAYGFTTITRDRSAYYAYWLMNNMLGQYCDRRAARRQHPRAPGDGVLRLSTFDANVIEGPLMIRAGVSRPNVDRAVASIDEEIDAHAR